MTGTGQQDYIFVIFAKRDLCRSERGKSKGRAWRDSPTTGLPGGKEGDGVVLSGGRERMKEAQEGENLTVVVRTGQARESEAGRSSPSRFR